MQLSRTHKYQILIILTVISIVSAKIGQSSITTLVFPWGARSTGLGETFTGIADDEQAIFYNPAGLGQAPLSNSWVHYEKAEDGSTDFLFISANKGSEKKKKEVWAVTREHKIVKLIGNKWVDHELYYLDSGQTIDEVAEMYIDIEESEWIGKAAATISEANGVENNKRKAILEILTDAKIDGTKDEELGALADALLALNFIDKNKEEVFIKIVASVQEESADSLADELVTILNEDVNTSHLYDIKIPFSIGPKGSINDIYTDSRGRFWVATNEGLWRYKNSWKRYNTLDGLPSDTITTISENANAEVLIGTKSGAAYFSDASFTTIGKDIKELNVPVTAITSLNDSTFFLGTTEGLLQLRGSKVSKIDTTKGRLFNNHVTALLTDSRERVWIGCKGGIVRIEGNKLKRFEFNENTLIYSFSEESSDKIWAATNNGATQYEENVKKENGKPVTTILWNSYHEKNTLNSSFVHDVSYVDGNLWLATDLGISKYAEGKKRVSIFFEQLLPSLGLGDLWHANVAGVFPIGDYGTAGLFFNQLYFGEIEDNTNQVESVHGQVEGNSSSAFEFATGLSYGFEVKENFSLGLNLKYAYSRLLKDKAEAQTFAVDIALLRKHLFRENLSMGFMLMNLGPSVKYGQSQDDNPIPFSLRYGISYMPINRPGSRLLVAIDLDREIVYREDGKDYNIFQQIYYELFDDDRETAKEEFEQIIFHGGIEYLYADFLAARLGGMYDKAGKRQEINFGLGANINPITADFSIIFTIGDNDVRQNQIRFSVAYDI